jgi:hypothetical protein
MVSAAVTAEKILEHFISFASSCCFNHIASDAGLILLSYNIVKCICVFNSHQINFGHLMRGSNICGINLTAILCSGTMWI